MKAVFSIIVCLIVNNLCYSQVDYSEDWVNSGWEYSDPSDSIIDVSEKIIYKKDLSYLLKSSYPNYIEDKPVIPMYGLLGEDFEKIEFAFTEITRSEEDQSQYVIKGKTKFHGNINDFDGDIIFNKATRYVSKSTMEQTVVVLTGSYNFAENLTVETAATYLGTIKMILFVKHNSEANMLFDMDMYYEDGAIRGFVGVRKTKQSDSSQSCIWGFPRFPHTYANYFDIGYGEEKINIKYAKPWFNYTEQEWNEIIKTDPNGIFTNEPEYINPEDATWFKLDPVDLEKRVLEQLNIDENRINFVTIEDLANNLNETVFVIGEIENEILDEDTHLDYKIKGHILLVNALTGKIKYRYSDKGWESNAEMLSGVTIDTQLYQLTKGQVAFGVKADYRGSSQSNPYSYTSLSLYIKEDDSLKKVLDNFIIDEYSGIVNVNQNACYADLKREKKQLVVLESSTNGYNDIQVKSTVVNTFFETDSDGECEPVEKSRVEKISALKYNNAKYKLEL